MGLWPVLPGSSTMQRPGHRDCLRRINQNNEKHKYFSDIRVKRLIEMTRGEIKLAPCPSCSKKDVSVNAAACPNCGEPITASTKSAMLRGIEQRRKRDEEYRAFIAREQEEFRKLYEYSQKVKELAKKLEVKCNTCGKSFASPEYSLHGHWDNGEPWHTTDKPREWVRLDESPVQRKAKMERNTFIAEVEEMGHTYCSACERFYPKNPKHYHSSSSSSRSYAPGVGISGR
jgi:hypothetical protein